MTAEPRATASAPATPIAGPRVRAIFLGSGEFAVPTLEALAAAPQIELVGVVAAPDRPVGRRQVVSAVPVAARARELGLPLLQPGRLRSAEAVEDIAALRPGVGVLADYGQIVPQAILDLPDHGILNVHPSLLPRHRGASPIPATILGRDAESGVTLIRMDAGLDTGPIVAVERWPLGGDETTPELERRAAEAGAALVLRTLGAWLRGELQAEPQDDAVATLTRPLRRDDGRLDPGRPAAELARQVRAYVPWPGSFVETDAGRLIVLRALAEPPDAADVAPGPAPGTLGPGPDLRLATSEGWLVMEEVQPAGGRPMPGAALLRGRPTLAHSRVG